MKTESIEFFSEGTTVRGYLHLPAAASNPVPVVVQGPGWLGLATGNTYKPWHEGLVKSGYAVLAFDYRGFGESDGQRGWIIPELQVQDILNAVTFAQTRPELDPFRIGIYGMGGIGGGNAVIATALDQRIRCIAVQAVVVDGADWLRGMRREYEWIEFLERVNKDRQRWVTEGDGERVDPREELMIAPPERKRLNPKKDVDAKMEKSFYLRSAEYLLRYKPLDYADRISPRGLLVTSVENDTVTPESHALALYDRAGSPKKLIRQKDTNHYQSLKDNYDVIIKEIRSWYDQHLDYSSIDTLRE